MREFGLIGYPLGHSFSARYFNDKFSREQIDDCSYSLFELQTIEELPRLIAQHPNLAGFNVTIPYKREVLRYLDDISSEARAIGAVNCVKIVDRRLIGYNTDVIGLRASLAKFLSGFTPENALILGTGGASQAVQYILAEFSIPFELVSRDISKGNYTYDSLPVEVVQNSKLIINATPVGTYPEVDSAPRVPYAYIGEEHYLFDLVYNPSVTAFLDYGMQRGAKVCNGEAMLLGQAEAAWEIWSK